MLIRPAQRNDRIFYTGMASLILLTVFAGFAPSYYLKGYFGRPQLSPLLHVHGALFTAWVLFFVVQPSLIAYRRLDLHRKLGYVVAGLAALMVPMGFATAIDAAQRGAAPPGIPPLAFLAVPMFDMVNFAAMVGAGMWLRRDKETHKRLMLLATIAILPAAVARLPYILPLGPLAFFGLADLFILGGMAYDYASRGRVHRAYLVAGLWIIASQPLRLALSGTDLWMRFAQMVVS